MLFWLFWLCLEVEQASCLPLSTLIHFHTGISMTNSVPIPGVELQLSLP